MNTTKQTVAIENYKDISISKLITSKVIRSKYYSDNTQLQMGNGLNAIAAMNIIQNAKDNMHHTNYAVKRMITSRLLFPPKKNINKFMIGGIAEECLHQLFVMLGYNSKNISDEVTLTDLQIEVPILINNEPILHDFNVSVKNSCDIKSQIILENYRGTKRDHIRELPPSFIIYTETHIQKSFLIYIDHEIIKQAYPMLSNEEFNNIIFKNTDSNLCIRPGFLRYFINRLPSEYILNIEYPELLQNMKPCNIVQIALNAVDIQLNNNNFNI